MRYLFLLSLIYIVFISCNNSTKRDFGKAELETDKLSDSTISYDNKKFDFEPDIRLFTTMCFANASGYDKDYATMTNERLEIRSYLDSILTPDFKEKISGMSKNEFFASIGSIAFSISNPPQFEWLPDSLSINYHPQKDENYLTLLTEFYSVANISDLWEKYVEKFRTENYNYIPFSAKAIEDIIGFCRVNKDYFDNKQFVFNTCALMQNKSAFTCYSETKIYIVISPLENEPSPIAFYHEALHNIINPIVDQFQEELVNMNEVGRIGFNARLQKMEGAYMGISDLFSECMVRTIDYILRKEYFNWDEEKTLNEIEKQYGYGLTLIPYLYERLLVYEKQSMSLEDYLPTIIQQIDIEIEKARWENFQQNK